MGNHFNLRREYGDLERIHWWDRVCDGKIRSMISTSRRAFFETYILMALRNPARRIPEPAK